MTQLTIVTTTLELAHLPTLSLRQKAVEVPATVDPQLVRQLIEQMLHCLFTAGGVGLAAPQVGVGWRLFLAMERGPDIVPKVLINPRLIDMADEQVVGREGCLSLPGYVSQVVPRARTVKVEALDQHLTPIQLEASDFLARVIQHEHDHLEGILYIDRLRSAADLEYQTPETRVQQATATLFA